MLWARVLMFFLLGCLLLGGWIYPELWFGAGFLAIYLVWTSQFFRHSPVEDKLRSMVAAHQNYAEFSDLQFEKARRYAQDKGAKANEQHSATVAVLVAGIGYRVDFSRVPSGGTAIFVEKLADIRRSSRVYSRG